MLISVCINMSRCLGKYVFMGLSFVALISALIEGRWKAIIAPRANDEDRLSAIDNSGPLRPPLQVEATGVWM